MVTLNPDTWTGRGTPDATQVVSARLDPKIASTIPGAQAWVKEAPFARPAMIGVAAVTAMPTVPEAAFRVASPAYRATMLLSPYGSCAAATVMLAEADGPVPVSGEMPI